MAVSPGTYNIRLQRRADTADAYVEIDAKLSSLDVPRLSL
jgi:hypothetical protein